MWRLCAAVTASCGLVSRPNNKTSASLCTLKKFATKTFLKKRENLIIYISFPHLLSIVCEYTVGKKYFLAVHFLVVRTRYQRYNQTVPFVEIFKLLEILLFTMICEKDNVIFPPPDVLWYTCRRLYMFVCWLNYCIVVCRYLASVFLTTWCCLLCWISWLSMPSSETEGVPFLSA